MVAPIPMEGVLNWAGEHELLYPATHPTLTLTHTHKHKTKINPARHAKQVRDSLGTLDCPNENWEAQGKIKKNIDVIKAKNKHCN